MHANLTYNSQIFENESLNEDTFDLSTTISWQKFSKIAAEIQASIFT